MAKRKKVKAQCNAALGLCFHGAYKSKAAAESKAAARGGFVSKIFGQFGSGPKSTRYVVATKGKRRKSAAERRKSRASVARALRDAGVPF